MASLPDTITVRVDDGDLARLEAVAERLERAAERMPAPEPAGLAWTRVGPPHETALTVDPRAVRARAVTGCGGCPFLCDTAFRCEAANAEVDPATLGVEPPPAWCPLRVGPIAVTLETGP